MHSSEFTNPTFLYNGLPASVASKLISVIPLSFASLINRSTISNAIPPYNIILVSPIYLADPFHTIPQFSPRQFPV